MPEQPSHLPPAPHVAGSIHHGHAVAVVRALLGVPAASLADAAGVSKFSLSRLERAHRSPAPGELRRLLTVLAELADGVASPPLGAPGRRGAR